MKKTIRNLLTLSATFMLAACNGGGNTGSPIYTDFYAARAQAREAVLLITVNPIFNEVKCEYSGKRNYEHKGVEKEEINGQYLIESDFDNQVVVHAYTKYEDKETYVSSPEDNMTMVDEFEYYVVYDAEKGIIAYYENFSEKEKYYEVICSLEDLKSEFDEMKTSGFKSLIGRDVTIEDAAAEVMVTFISNKVNTGEGFAFGQDVYPLSSVTMGEELGDKVVNPEYEVNFDQHDLSYKYTLDESDDDEECTLTYAGVFKNNKFTSGSFVRARKETSGDDTYIDDAREEASLVWGNNTIELPDLSSFPEYN